MMTRDKIKQHIISSILGPQQSATVQRLALDHMVPRVFDRAAFVCELAWETCCTVMEIEDDAYLFRRDTLRSRDDFERAAAGQRRS